MDYEPGPQVMFIPRFVATPSRLKCTNGWSAETTAAFQECAFESIELWGAPGREFTIPALGPKAATVRRMTLEVDTAVFGLDQFCHLEFLTVLRMPANGLDAAMFPALQVLSVSQWHQGFSNLELLFSHLASFDCDKWSSKFAPYVFCRNKLTSLCIGHGYAQADCTDFQLLPQLKSLALHSARISSLKGLACCRNLEELYLSSLKNIRELVPVSNFPNLRVMHVDELNGVAGTFSLAGASQLVEVHIVKCQTLEVDLSGIENMPNLELLWLGVPDRKLDLDAAFTRPRLRMLQVADSDLGDSDLQVLATRHGRILREIERVGPKKNRSLRLTFEEQDSWLAARDIPRGEPEQIEAPPGMPNAVKAASNVSTVMGDVLWCFDGSRFEDQAHFSDAVRQYQVDVAKRDTWLPHQIALSVPTVRVKYLRREAEAQIGTVVELSSDNGQVFTALELLFKIHNAVVEALRDSDYHFFEGLTLQSTPSAKAPPRYVLNQGS